MIYIKRLFHSGFFILFSRIFLSLILIYASYYKILDYDGFYDAIDNYDLLGDSLSYYISRIFPWVELLLGLCLLFCVRLKFVTLFSSFIFIVFIFFLFSAFARNMSIDCGCFYAHNGGSDISYVKSILFDVFCFLLLINIFLKL